MDVLVNNAGVLQQLAQTSDEQYEQMFNINTRGTFNMLAPRRPGWPTMVA